MAVTFRTRLERGTIVLNLAISAEDEGVQIHLSVVKAFDLPKHNLT